MEAVVFDMDGVIFDSEILVVKVWKIVADRHGFENVEEVCRRCFGTNTEASRRIFKEYYGEDFPYDEYRQEKTALFYEYASGGKLAQKPGVKELLSYLKEKQIKVALASSTREEIVRQELEEGGLLQYFDAVICGDMVKRSKPEPDIYEKACEALGVRPDDSYAIEDSYNGIRSAYKAGLHPIMVPDLAEATEEMHELSECILPSLYEVKTYFEEKIKK